MNKEELAGYETVDSRKKKFFDKFPDGRIIVECLSADGSTALFKCTLYKNKEEQGSGNPFSTGHAQEFKGQGSFANKYSWVENCFHGDTEILTREGWVTLKDYVDNPEMNEKVAAYDYKNTCVRFEQPDKKIKQENRELLLIEDNFTAQCVTPDHNVMIGGQKVLAKDVQPVVNDIQHLLGRNLKTGVPYLPSDDFARLLQWIIADGCITENVVRFGFTKDRKIERLIELCEKCGVNFKTSQTGEVKTLSIKSAAFLLNFIPGKTLPFDLCLRLTKSEAQAFIDEVGITDGTLCSKGSGAIFLRQTDYNYFQNLNLLCVLNGYSVGGIRTYQDPGSFENGKPIHHQRIKEDMARRLLTAIEKAPGLHTVYCLTMPTGTLVTRFKDKITVSFNCETSAVGRALANAGFSGHSCSYEEMLKVERHTEMEMALPKESLTNARTGNLSEVTVPFGRSKGLAVSQMRTEDLLNDSDYWTKRLSLEGKPPSGKLKEYLDAISFVLSQRESESETDIPQ